MNIKQCKQGSNLFHIHWSQTICLSHIRSEYNCNKLSHSEKVRVYLAFVLKQKIVDTVETTQYLTDYSNLRENKETSTNTNT